MDRRGRASRTLAPPRRELRSVRSRPSPLARTSSSATRQRRLRSAVSAPHSAAPARCPCHTTSPITRAAASARPRAIQPQGVLLEEDSPLVVAGGITSGTVVVSAVVAVSVVVSDVVTVRVGRCPRRCGPCRSGPRQPGLGAERATLPSSAGPEREACDGHQGKHRRDLHEPAKHLSPVGVPHGESLIPALAWYTTPIG